MNRSISLHLFRLIVVLFLACVAPLRAHDTYEVTMTATIRPTTMDLVLTFAGATPAAFTNLGAFALPNGSNDAALLLDLLPGAYTVHAGGASGITGIVLIEIYDAGPP